MPQQKSPSPIRIEHTADRIAPGALQPILVVSLGCVLVWSAVAIVTPPLRVILPYQLLAAIVIAGCLALSRSGHTRAATVLFCVVLWILVQLPPFITGRVAAPAIVFPPLLVLVAGLIWSVRAAIVLALASAAAWFVGMVAIAQGVIVPSAPPRTDFQFWLLLTESLTVVTVGLVVARRSLAGTLRGSVRSSAQAADVLTGSPDAGRSSEAGPGLDQLQLVGQLAGGVAHDFNNLLTIVGGATGLIEDDPEATQSILELATEIRKAQERAAVITSRLLAFAQRQTVEVQPVEVAAAVELHVARLRPYLERSVTLEISVTKEDTTVLTSEAELGQILLNLLSNAQDAVDGTGRIVVSVDYRILEHELDGPAGVISAGHYVVISVEDAGRGMAPAVLGRVFEPFFTTHGPSTGRGLGLSAVLGSTRRCGGQIAIRSEEGKGTAVEILLPLAAARSMRVN